MTAVVADESELCIGRGGPADRLVRRSGLYKNWNYRPPGSPEYQKYKAEIEQAAQQPAA